MPIIVAVAHQKGGVGKSTLAANLAAYYTVNGSKSAVVDADIQGSLTNLVETYGENNIYGSINLVPRNEYDRFEDLKARDEDILFIDTPPYLSTDLDEIFLVSDYVLVPTKISPLDMLAIEATLELLSNVLKVKPSLVVGIVINLVNQSEGFLEKIKDYLKERGRGIQVHDTVVIKRTEFQRSFLTGSIFETKDKKAQKEIATLAEEIITNLEKVRDIASDGDVVDAVSEGEQENQEVQSSQETSFVS